MKSIARSGHLLLVVALAVLSACTAGQKEPAQKMLADIDATVIAASDEASRYIPDQLEDVAKNYDALKASFDKQDYAAVVHGGPDVLAAAQNLATAAAAKKDSALKSQNDEWTVLAASVPDHLSAVGNRLDELRRPSNKHLVAGVDLDAVKLSLDQAALLWSKAQAAFASGNMDEAVRTAQDVKVKVDAAAAAIRLDLGAPVG